MASIRAEARIGDGASCPVHQIIIRAASAMLLAERRAAGAAGDE